MKVRIDFTENLEEDEVIIRCQKMTENIQKLQQAIFDVTYPSQKLSFYKDDTEYYLSLDNILFFETYENRIHAHTQDDVYVMKYRLYELEEILPRTFIRVSKSTILNISQIFSINRTLAAPNIVQFYNSHKQVYVSRYYFKELKTRLEERR